MSDCKGEPELILIATGSEVSLAMEAKEQLENIRCRVVSMPATDVFDVQSPEYQQQVLPSHITQRIAIEAGIRDYWFKYVGLQGDIVGMTSFGESAPAEQLFEMFGFTVENVVAKAKAVLEK